MYDRNNQPDKCPECGGTEIECCVKEVAFCPTNDYRVKDIGMFFCMNLNCSWNSDPFEW